jgi:transcriptional regulator with XRE-family HTH domain
MPRMQKHYPHVIPAPPGAPVSTGYTSALVRQEFAHRLKKLMTKKGMSQSDLARAAFGLDDPGSRSKVPKGRDRISAYLNARQFPDDENLEALAKALDLAPEDLTPKIEPETSLKSEQVFDVQRHPNSTRARVVLIQDLEMEVVLKIMALLVAHPDESADQPSDQAKLGGYPKANPPPKSANQPSDQAKLGGYPKASPAPKKAGQSLMADPKPNPAPKRSVLSLPKSNPTPDPAPQQLVLTKKKVDDEEADWDRSYQEDPLGLSDFLRS